jgi:succinyl-diaminopimelate desuccinylase
MLRRCLIPLLFALAIHAQTASDVRRIYHDQYASRMEPVLCEAVAFRTEAGHADAIAAQARWLEQKAKELGFVYHDAGPVTEIELPGPQGAPVLGLVVHGDVQPAGENDWTVPPFTCTRKDGYVYGRGVADDKGPMVQALLSMAALRASGWPRTHTIRLMVGSDEESGSTDVGTYLKTHTAPPVTLVLDSAFPVVVGEKAWDRLDVTVADPYQIRAAPGDRLWALEHVEAGIAASIVPPRAVARLRWLSNGPVSANFCPAAAPAGFRCETAVNGDHATLTVIGKAAHAGVNIEGGRNALVLLANLLIPAVAPSGAADLLEFAAMAGKDLHGTGLGLTQTDRLWGRYAVNVATLTPANGNALQLSINLRRIPPATHQQALAHLETVLTDFNRTHGASLQSNGGYFKDEPTAFDPNSKLVQRLLADYTRATGENAPPAISGGGTYAARFPNAIAFGMWFPGKPYPGHDVDERIPVADLHRGVDVLLEALADLACSAPIPEPFRP